ncbi:hypothetical protein [Streptomyces sp. NPDC059080]|uniref:hypothetical protein n=1 Tax=Streptomyces sp. NPDC059080 TaxID=3346718 RepID=UPI0036CB85BF
MDAQTTPTDPSDEAPEHVPDPETPTGDPAPTTTDEPAPDGAQSDDGEQDETALPDWARTELASVRKEAAKYRVAAKELRESLAKATSPEEYEAASARVAELETELHRERLARKYQLPEAVAARVTGETEDAREADAKALAEVFHTRTVPLGRGGLDPAEKPTTPKDPAALAALVRRRRT